MDNLGELVESIKLCNRQLYRIHELVDELKRSNERIRQDGVFLGIVEDSADETTPLQHFLDKLKEQNVIHADEHCQPPTKQVPISFPHCPGLFGFRSFRYKVEAEIESGTQVCTQEDVEKFFDDNLDPSSYSKATCCTYILDTKGVHSLLDHLWKETRRLSVSISNPHYKKTNKRSAIADGKRNMASYKRFTNSFSTLSDEQKMEQVNKALSKDRRELNEGCRHQSCIMDDDFDESAQGVMYGSGVPVADCDNFLMTNCFKMIALPVITPLRLLDEHHFGLTRPMLYYGSTHSFFPAHYEDMSLFSINFIHHGHPKLWIVVPPTSVTNFRNAIRDSGSNLMHTSCPNVLGHKYFLPTTLWLQENKLPFKVVIQRVRQAVILYPNAVHFGFNLGPQVAEAANFLSKSWVPYGMAAQKCHCIDGQVHLRLESIVAATHPEWFDLLLSGQIPTNLSEQEHPDFYQSIPSNESSVVTVTPSTRGNISEEGEAEGAAVDDGDVSESIDEDKEKFPEPPRKRRGRKQVSCPKASCSKCYSGGKVPRLLKHIKEEHSRDPSYQQFLEEVQEMCPSRDKVPKKECKRCGKLIAGRASQMRAHMATSDCITSPLTV